MLEETNPLQTTFKQRGIVSSRDALLRRSAEIEPLVVKICSKEQHLSIFSFLVFLLSGVLKGSTLDAFVFLPSQSRALDVT